MRLDWNFYKKQDYEPFAVPMGYPILEDLNAKSELKKMDLAISRTMQQAILLVTMGTEPEKGGINHENLKKMQSLFGNESVGRVLIADYTTKAEFAEVKDSRTIPGELTYMFGGKAPARSDYKSREVFES